MKLITLTLLTNKQPIVINPAHVVSFDTNAYDKQNGTVVALVNRMTHTVTESLQTIRDMIEVQ